MSRLETILEQMKDYEIDQVNRYLKGEHVDYRRGRFERDHVTWCLIAAIERECGIHAKGIEVGSIHLTRYKREIKRRKKYWERVRKGETTDTRRGFDKERRNER